MKLREKKTEDYQGQPVRFFELENDHGLKARVMSYGATLVSLYSPIARAGSKMWFSALTP